MAKSPMLPNGGILTRPSNKSCRASNSGWKSGIVSLIWLNQSKKGPIRNLDLIFGKIVLVWNTADIIDLYKFPNDDGSSQQPS